MDKISKIFNFDDIGYKIKSVAQAFCWIVILVIWISAPIVMLVLLMIDDTAELFWIPIVCGVFGPLVVWLGSWGLYAFGELVEDIHAIRNKEGTTAEVMTKGEAEKAARFEAKVAADREAKEKESFACPNCGNIICYGQANCISCGQQFDWSKM